ncbi:hypothetical protein D3C75_1272390 [compost metagenome]
MGAFEGGDLSAGRQNVLHQHNFLLDQTVVNRAVDHGSHREGIVAAGDNGQSHFVGQKLHFVGGIEAPGDEHRRP